ncbi:MAG: glucan 1,4-alpha-glucosidase [Anaerolineaceae bacterium]|nr:glucan 1,4-alpha-glucosidase [Anaerolineaceae bacterium]
MDEHASLAPGGPGIPARWSSSAKTGVGTSLTHVSRVWFTLSHGILDEIYYPGVDHACTRDLGFIVTDGNEFFSEEKRLTTQKVEYLAKGVPAYHLTNTCNEKRYRIEKVVISDPRRDVVLQKVTFTPLMGTLDDFHLYALLAPHLANFGMGNTGWLGDYKGTPMLFAERKASALAMGCTAPWLGRSTGFVGVSDGWQDLNQHKKMTWFYDRAENGNIALMGEIDLKACGGSFVLAVGFGQRWSEAGHRTLASLLDVFEDTQAEYIQQWQEWQKGLEELQNGSDIYRTSTIVLNTHEAKNISGGLIASLSIPWGFDKGDDDLGGYHLAWPRDLVETAGGLLAAGAHESSRRILHYLVTTQDEDGHWPQNMWLDGLPYWDGVQLDETAFPILLIELARRENALFEDGMKRLWPMVRKAAGFLVRNGPVTQQDRWEEDPGYSPFTLAAEIAALLVAADVADLNGEQGIAGYLRDTADAWNEGIERWIYVTGTDLAQQVGVEGYYVRIAPPEVSEAASPVDGFVPIKNRPPDQTDEPAIHIISPDALALVRFGLREPGDPHILNTIKVIDKLLMVDLPTGASWHRYNDDGYGEHEDGSPFDGTGVGQAWPLLTGERAHYELACGNRQRAEELLHAMESFANEGGLIPEQVWTGEDIPERELFKGRPSGSAMPLVWAHAEYIKLLRSLKDGRVFDMPQQTVQRYLKDKTPATYTLWSFNQKTQIMAAAKILRIGLNAAAEVVWTMDNWQTTHHQETCDTGLGLHIADLAVNKAAGGTQVEFTFHWTSPDGWEGENYLVQVAG